MPHVLKKIHDVVPTVANLDTSTAVVDKTCAGRVVAARVHVGPNVIKASAAQAMAEAVINIVLCFNTDGF